MTDVFYIGPNNETIAATVTDDDWGVRLNIQVTRAGEIIQIGIPYIDASDIVLKLRTMLGESSFLAEIKEEEKNDGVTTEGGIARY